MNYFTELTLVSADKSDWNYLNITSITFYVMLEPAISFLAIACQILAHFDEHPMYVSAYLLILLIIDGWMESNGFNDLELNCMADMA